MMIKPRHISDAVLKQLMAEPIARLNEGVEPAARPEPKNKNSTKTRKKKSETNKKTREETQPEETISNELRMFLLSIHDRPLLSATARRDDLGETSDGFARLKRESLDAELVEEYSVNLGSAAGGIVKQLALTKRGHAALGKTPENLPPANVSWEHWFWAKAIHRYLMLDGYTAEIEKCLEGKCADVGVKRPDGWCAYEIAMSANNEAVNVKRDLDAGFAAVKIGCRNKTVLRAVNSKLNAHLSEDQKARVSVKLLSELWFVLRLIKEISGVGCGS